MRERLRPTTNDQGLSTELMKTLQRTLTIVKPDAVRKNAIGDIIEQVEKNGFRILAMKMPTAPKTGAGSVWKSTAPDKPGRPERKGKVEGRCQPLGGIFWFTWNRLPGS